MNDLTTAAYKAGDTVRIVVGAHGGRIGKARTVGTTAVYVEFQAPILLTQPDGPTRSVTLPFAPREIEHTADLMPAQPGRHRRLTVPANGRDADSKAACTGSSGFADACGWSDVNSPHYCPQHYSIWYAEAPGGAKHRADVAS